MSLLSSLRPKWGATGYRKRVGRGTGSGLGGTAGKGHKGQKARAGGRVRWGFEGGQTPLMRRLPKFGFSNVTFETRYDVFTLSQLSKVAAMTGKDVTPETLEAAGLLKQGLIKILASGELTKAVTVHAHKFSEAAKAAIEKAGGKAVVLEAKVSKAPARGSRKASDAAARTAKAAKSAAYAKSAK
ncbi:50S ribosomal protein L15 [bacterium]|nr:MAG: 50S ribosomal protein L15 [bacterium]